MALVDAATYRLLTGDNITASAAVDEQLAVAQELVEDYLARPLEDGEHTERLRVFPGGRVFPSATPVTDPGDLTVEGAALVGAAADWPPGVPFAGAADVDAYATVTYRGGWTAATAPTTVKREIARAAYRQLHPVTGVPVGATAAHVGDAGVTFASAVSTVAELDVDARRTLRRYRKARL